MDYLNNELELIHRDLKAKSFFLDLVDEKLQVKLGDFECRDFDYSSIFEKNTFDLDQMKVWFNCIYFFSM